MNMVSEKLIQGQLVLEERPAGAIALVLVSCKPNSMILVLRIQLKLNTALLSTVRPCVRPSVRHRRDISHFSNI